MNIDNLTKEELQKYKELLSELKREKIALGINISYTTISLLSFIYYGQGMELNKMVVSAIVTIAGLNSISSKTEDINDTKKRLLKFKEKEE